MGARLLRTPALQRTTPHAPSMHYHTYRIPANPAACPAPPAPPSSHLQPQPALKANGTDSKPLFMAGNSLGGLVGSHVVLRRPDTFAGLLMQSPGERGCRRPRAVMLESCWGRGVIDANVRQQGSRAHVPSLPSCPSAAIDVEWTPILKFQAAVGNSEFGCVASTTTHIHPRSSRAMVVCIIPTEGVRPSLLSTPLHARAPSASVANRANRPTRAHTLCPQSWPPWCLARTWCRRCGRRT